MLIIVLDTIILGLFHSAKLNCTCDCSDGKGENRNHQSFFCSQASKLCFVAAVNEIRFKLAVI